MEKPQFISKSERERIALERLNTAPLKRKVPPQLQAQPLSDHQMKLMSNPEKKKKRINDKKFIFDWKASDDTSLPQESLYQRKVDRLFPYTQHSIIVRRYLLLFDPLSIILFLFSLLVAKSRGANSKGYTMARH